MLINMLPLKMIVFLISANMLVGASIESTIQQRLLETNHYELHTATQDGDINEINRLLKQGAHIDAKNDFGMTALHCATANGKDAIVALLLEKNASIDAKNYCGNTPLYIAAAKGHTQLVRLLIDKGAAIDVQNNTNDTPVRIAVSQKYLKIVAILLSHGAHTALADSYDRTPQSMVDCSSNDPTITHEDSRFDDTIPVKDQLELILDIANNTKPSTDKEQLQVMNAMLQNNDLAYIIAQNGRSHKRSRDK